MVREFAVRTGAQHALDQRDRALGPALHFKIPQPNHAPSLVRKQLRHTTVTPSVLIDLGLPIRRRGWPDEVGVPVPIRAIDEHCHLEACENDIGPPWQLRVVAPVTTQPYRPKCATQHKLNSRITAADTRHDLPAVDFIDGCHGKSMLPARRSA